jgi:alpha-glucosidase (family GH31 glycosyl hydrolase)
MRLHSSASPFLNKEPWVVEEPYHSAMKKFMRLRHRLVPYLYTENYRAYSEGKPLVRPMYYDNPDNEGAYNVPGEYGFGDSLIVGAITRKADEKLRLSSVNMLIPEGRYVDILNGRVYQGGRIRKLHRDITKIPVLMKAGTILPLAPESSKNGTDIPVELELLVAAGAEGNYTLYEDDGNTTNYKDGSFVKTAFECSYDEKNCSMTVTVQPSKGDLSLIPKTRDYTITLLGTGEPRTIEAFGVKADSGITVTIENVLLSGNDHQKEVFDILERAYIEINKKDMIFNAVSSMSPVEFLDWLKTADVADILKDALMEVFEDSL